MYATGTKGLSSRCFLSNNAAPSLNKCVCIHPLSTPRLAITPSSPAPHSPICCSPSNHGVFFLPEISPCSFSRLLLATQLRACLSSCDITDNLWKKASLAGIKGTDRLSQISQPSRLPPRQVLGLGALACACPGSASCCLCCYVACKPIYLWTFLG